MIGYIVLSISVLLFSALVYLNVPMKINQKLILNIKEKGFSHITRERHIQKIMDHEGYANFLPSKGIKSYATFFRGAAFFFIGTPNYFKYFYNIDFDIRNKDKKMIKIDPENINDELLSKLYWRRIDKTIMYFDTIRILATVEDVNLKERNFRV